MIITGQLSGSQDFGRSPEINSSCGHYETHGHCKSLIVRMLLKHLSRESDTLKHNLEEKKICMYENEGEDQPRRGYLREADQRLCF